MTNAPTASHSLTVRLEITNQPGMLGKVTSAIGKAGGDIGAIDVDQYYAAYRLTATLLAYVDSFGADLQP